jgi:hypothetical protein
VALRSFLALLSETGRAAVDRPDAPLESTTGEANDLLVSFDALAREQAPFTAPAFSLDVGRWAAELMYRACQCLVYRELGEEAVRAAFAPGCPQPLSAGTIYSADLVLRYLADLATLARATSERDVLVDELATLAAAWPLSSVGMPRLPAGQLDSKAMEAIVGDRCLRQLYIDRVIARRDESRLAYPAVREGVREAIGLYDTLWPEGVRREAISQEEET